MPQTSDIVFTIGANKEIGGGPFDVIQGIVTRVTFKNESNETVTVRVTGEQGALPASLFHNGRTTFTVEAGKSVTDHIGLAPNRGTYVLSTGTNGSGAINVRAITFTIDANGNIDNDRDGEPVVVTLGGRPTVIFKNDSGAEVTVHVTGGARASGGSDPTNPGRLFGKNQPGFGDGQTMFTIPPAESKEQRIGPFPNQGRYVLSTGGNHSARIEVRNIKLTIEADNAGRPTISRGTFAVTAGAELPVDFENKTRSPVTVYIFGENDSGASMMTPDPTAFFRVGPNSDVKIDPMTKINDKPVATILIPAKEGTENGMARATISASAPRGNFAFSLTPGDAGPCVSNPWINVNPS